MGGKTGSSVVDRYREEVIRGQDGSDKNFRGVFNFRCVCECQEFGSDHATDTPKAGRTTFASVNGGV